MALKTNVFALYTANIQAKFLFNQTSLLMLYLLKLWSAIIFMIVNFMEMFEMWSKWLPVKNLLYIFLSIILPN